ncbi:MAG: hypothetical protein J6K32_03925 [Clostridia bacterium]|nr:hypothetical protein [Clostridia bacterium]
MPDPSTHLLQGDVRRLILRIALPSTLAMLASGVGVFLDALLLARSGAHAAAASAAAYPLLLMIQTVGFTLGTGSGSAVSRLTGSGEWETAARCAACALALSLALGCAIAGGGLMLHGLLLRLLGTPQQALPDAAAYTRCVLLSAPLSCLGFVVSSLLRGLGHTLPSLAAYACGAAAGTGLSLLLTLHMGLGAHGAGIALLSREAVCTLILAGCGLRQIRRASFRRLLPLCIPRRSVLREIMRSGLPALLRQGSASTGSLLLSRACAAAGEAALSGMGLAMRTGALITSGMIGFGQGFQPVCGCALGAGETNRARTAYRFCMRCLVLSLAAVGAALYLCAGHLLAVSGAEAEAAAFGAAVLRAQALVLPAQGAVILMTMLSQAAGRTVRSIFISSSRQGLFLIPLVLLLPRLMGRAGLVLCQSICDLLALPFCLLLSRGLFDSMPRRRGKSPPPSVDESPLPGVQ